MVYSVNDTKDFNASVNIGTGISCKTDKEYIYCELTYWDKVNGKRYNKVYPAAKFDEVCRTYYALNNGEIPEGEIKRAVERIA